jgi:hypothetical protein
VNLTLNFKLLLGKGAQFEKWGEFMFSSWISTFGMENFDVSP